MAAEALYRANVLICGGTGCVASASEKAFEALQEELVRRGLDKEVRVVQTGCRGFCAMGPVVMIYPEGIFYCQVQPEDVPLLVEETLIKGRVVERLAYREPAQHKAIPHYGEIPFYKKQLRIALRKLRHDRPGKDRGVHRPRWVRGPDEGHHRDDAGRGDRPGEGLGPPRARWSGLSRGPQVGVYPPNPGRAEKYVVCNADEGDPGAFMDRSIIEGDPHSVIEGMAIAAYAIGAREGYVYCRAEYPLAIKRLEIAIQQAEEYGSARGRDPGHRQRVSSAYQGGGRGFCVR